MMSFGGGNLLFIIPAIIGSLVGVAGLITAYLTSRRQSSGSIYTSSADTLWRENGQLRDFLKTQVAELDRQVRELKSTYESVLQENRQLHNQVDDLEDNKKTLDSRVAELIKENQELQVKIEKLIGEKGELTLKVQQILNELNDLKVKCGAIDAKVQPNKD